MSVDEDLGRIRVLKEGESHWAMNLEGEKPNTALQDVHRPELLMVGRKNFGVEMDCIYCFSNNCWIAVWPDIDKLMRMLVIRIKSWVMAMNSMPFRCKLWVLTPVAIFSKEDSIVVIVFSEPCPQFWRIHFVLNVGLCLYMKPNNASVRVKITFRLFPFIRFLGNSKNPGKEGILSTCWIWLL